MRSLQPNTGANRPASARKNHGEASTWREFVEADTAQEVADYKQLWSGFVQGGRHVIVLRRCIISLRKVITARKEVAGRKESALKPENFALSSEVSRSDWCRLRATASMDRDPE